MAAGLFPIHECVFNGDYKHISSVLKTHDVSEKDYHGNTPLHIAVMMGHKEFIQTLLSHGATVRIKNNRGWSPLAEAISYGDRQCIKLLLRKLKQQSHSAFEQRRPYLIKTLKEIHDFYLELKWDFHSWVPLLSRMLPSDTCRIYKKGAYIRVDTTLVDFNDMRWRRGDITFLFHGETKSNLSIAVLDNENQVYQRLKYQETDADLEEEVDILMTSDIISAALSVQNVAFTQLQKGWIIKENKVENIGLYSAIFYGIHGLSIKSKKRREHLSEEDITRNKAALENLRKGNVVCDCDGKCYTQRKRSLHPPLKSEICWDEYLFSDLTETPTLARQHIVKETKKTFKAVIAMSEDFPLKTELLLKVLQLLAPIKQLNQLEEFIQMKLPPGFPIKLEMPILPTITAKVTFTAYKDSVTLPISAFHIPHHYTEDPDRFPDL